jgi:hypothetical protein
MREGGHDKVYNAGDMIRRRHFSVPTFGILCLAMGAFLDPAFCAGLRYPINLGTGLRYIDGAGGVPQT